MKVESQILYKPNRRYVLVYVNKELFKEIYGHDFITQDIAFLEEEFHVTTLKEDSTGEIIGKGYADYQVDPTDIALSGNLGSGRSIFYKDIFNLKGLKTSLATSKKEEYNNGVYTMPMALKEATISGILSKELPITTFETFAIFHTGKFSSIRGERLENDGSISHFMIDDIPEAIEVRVAKENTMVRLSNYLADKAIEFSMQSYIEKAAELEAYKYVNRIIHGSWSVGNITVDANLLDFDTVCFTKDYTPRFTNTSKFKETYFGYENLGQDNIIKIMGGNTEDVERFEKLYEKWCRIYFLKLLGLSHTQLEYIITEYNDKLEELYKLFTVLSKMHVSGDEERYMVSYNDTAIYKFNRYFSIALDKSNSQQDRVEILLDKNVKLGTYNAAFRSDYKRVIGDDYTIYDLDSVIDDLEKLAVKFDNMYQGLFSVFTSKEKEVVSLNAKYKNSERFYSGRCDFYENEIYKYDYKEFNEDLQTTIESIVRADMRGDTNNKNFNLRLQGTFSFININESEEIRVIVESRDNAYTKIDIGEHIYKLNKNDVFYISECITPTDLTLLLEQEFLNIS